MKRHTYVSKKLRPKNSNARSTMLKELAGEHGELRSREVQQVQVEEHNSGDGRLRANRVM